MLCSSSSRHVAELRSRSSDEFCEQVVTLHALGKYNSGSAAPGAAPPGTPSCRRAVREQLPFCTNSHAIKLYTQEIFSVERGQQAG